VNALLGVATINDPIGPFNVAKFRLTDFCTGAESAFGRSGVLSRHDKPRERGESEGSQSMTWERMDRFLKETFPNIEKLWV